MRTRTSKIVRYIGIVRGFKISLRFWQKQETLVSTLSPMDQTPMVSASLLTSASLLAPVTKPPLMLVLPVIPKLVSLATIQILLRITWTHRKASVACSIVTLDQLALWKNRERLGRKLNTISKSVSKSEPMEKNRKIFLSNLKEQIWKI